MRKKVELKINSSRSTSWSTAVQRAFNIKDRATSASRQAPTDYCLMSMSDAAVEARWQVRQQSWLTWRGEE